MTGLKEKKEKEQREVTRENKGNGGKKWVRPAD